MRHPVSVDAVRAARRVLRGRILPTPLVPGGTLTTPGGSPVLLKAECLQATGSFKVRGATYKLSRLTAAARARGVIAYSTGNHAQAVARAAGQLGIPATVVMSPDAPDRKVQATRAWGAAVVMAQPTSQARRELAERLAREQGLALVPPYDDVDVITGQGTVGLEILEQADEVPAAVIVPIGGGGLIAGVAAVVKALAPAVRVVGVEPELENDAWQSFQCGERVSLPDASASIADAVKVQTLGDLTYPLIREYVDDVVTVSERQIRAAVALTAVEAHLVVEPAGALALAAALVYADRPSAASQPVIALASGGNTTRAALCHALGRPEIQRLPSR
jgi:threonine dehydratase